jgi:hypothetical protein
LGVGRGTLFFCYYIIKGEYPSRFLSLIVFIFSFIVAVIIYNIKNIEIANYIISIFGVFLPNRGGIDGLTNEVNSAQIKYKKLDENIRSRPSLYFIVRALIVIVSLTFIIFLSYLSLKLFK